MKIREIQKIKRENVQNTNIEAENLSEAVHGKSKSLLPSFFLQLWSFQLIHSKLEEVPALLLHPRCANAHN